MAARPRTIIAAVFITVVSAAVAVQAGRPALSRWVWTELSRHIEQHFDAELEADSFDVHLLPRVEVAARGIRLYPRGNRETDPLLSAGSFRTSTTFRQLWNGGLQRVAVEDVTVAIPRGSGPSPLRPRQPDREADKGPEPRTFRRVGGLVIDEIAVTRAQVVIAPDNPSGLPLLFDIEMARLTGFSADGPASFEARLTNPRPRGLIKAKGEIGPWRPDDPRRTALRGRYSLEHADMSVFRGISGTLESTGTFSGYLAAIAVDGTARMPDFSVDLGGHPMPLETTFAARVDGTNGNTFLDRVQATLGGSPLEASGEIAGTPGSGGKTIKLDVAADAARLEDLIGLVVRERPTPMRGQLMLRARLELPPGDRPVVEALRLQGRFAIRRGRFASDTVQDRVDELSRRGRGEPKNQAIDNVLSEFGGDFSLDNGILRLPRLQFAVRGAEVRLAGSYHLRGERLGFAGELRLQARVSQTTTGFKSLLLKVIDPFFRKHGAGAVLPIRVAGTVSQPQFGLALFGRK